MNHETVCRAWRSIIHIRDLGGEPIVYTRGYHRAQAKRAKPGFISGNLETGNVGTARTLPIPTRAD
jgi:hypothetical protein